MTIENYIQINYKQIRNKIIAVTKNHQHTDDLVSDLILDLLEKNSDFIQQLLVKDKVQHYLIKSAYIQYNSSTSPFYLKYRKEIFGEITEDMQLHETQDIHQDTEKLVNDIKLYIGNLPVYERTLAQRHIIEGHSGRKMSKMYNINRIHISKDINNIKKNIRLSFNKQEYKTK